MSGTSTRSKTVCPTCHRPKGRRECVEKLCAACCRHLGNIRTCSVHPPRLGLSDSSIDLDDEDDVANSNDADLSAMKQGNTASSTEHKYDDNGASDSSRTSTRDPATSAADARLADNTAQQANASSAAVTNPRIITHLADVTPPAWAQALVTQLQTLQAQMVAVQTAVAATPARLPPSPPLHLPPMPRPANGTPPPAALQPPPP